MRSEPDSSLQDTCSNVFFVFLLLIAVSIIIVPVVIGYKYLQASYLTLFGPSFVLFGYLSHHNFGVKQRFTWTVIAPFLAAVISFSSSIGICMSSMITK